MEISKEEMETINSPRLEYARHVTFVLAEASTIVGMSFGAVPTRLSKTLLLGSSSKKLRKQIFMRGIGAGGISGFTFGCMAGPVVSLFLMKGLKMSEIYENCYELRHDQADILRDRWAVIGWFAGVTTGFLFHNHFRLANMPALGGVTGISAGSVAGVLASVVLVTDSDKIDKRTDKDLDNGTNEEFDNITYEELDNRTGEKTK